jgi:hypothetical protein
VARIKDSTEWTLIEMALNSKCRNLTHCNDVRKMIRNITTEVTELSKAEVLARQGRGTQAADLLKKINQDIEMVEEYLLVAALLG